MTTLKERMQAIKEGKADPPPIAKTLGINLVEAHNGVAVATMKVDERFHNPMGTLHGGIMTDLADLSMGVAIASLLGDNESFTTLELKINFLRPVYQTELRAEAKVVHRGRTIALVQSILTNDEGKEVARVTATQFILRPS
jgi:uncharacterized protein (TIGR00369 family)